MFIYEYLTTISNNLKKIICVSGVHNLIDVQGSHVVIDPIRFSLFLRTKSLLKIMKRRVGSKVGAGRGKVLLS